MVDTKCLIRYSLFDVNAVGLIGEARDLSLILNIMNPRLWLKLIVVTISTSIC